MYHESVKILTKGFVFILKKQTKHLHYLSSNIFHLSSIIIPITFELWDVSSYGLPPVALSWMWYFSPSMASGSGLSVVIASGLV